MLDIAQFWLPSVLRSCVFLLRLNSVYLMSQPGGIIPEMVCEIKEKLDDFQTFFQQYLTSSGLLKLRERSLFFFTYLYFSLLTFP